MRVFALIISILVSSCGDSAAAGATRYLWAAMAHDYSRLPSPPPALSSNQNHFDETCKRGDCPAVDLSLTPSIGTGDGEQTFEGMVNVLVNWPMRFNSSIKEKRVMITIKENPTWMRTSGRWIEKHFHVFGKPDKTTETGTFKLIVRDLSRCLALEKNYSHRCSYPEAAFPDYEKASTIQFKVIKNPDWPSR